MFDNFLYLLLALFMFSFLIFIHELGHYFMARRVGMQVQVFSIGFGKPIFQWEWQGVKWQIGWLLFGGYVKIAGMEDATGEKQSKSQTGFFDKSPWARIKVAFMGPAVNILFAFFIFALIWELGGRTKSMREFTPVIGYIDEKSELYQDGIRPGDELISLNDHEIHELKDQIYALLGQEQVKVKGTHFDLASHTRKPFEIEVDAYPHPKYSDKNIPTIGILQPASYLIYNLLPNGDENPLIEGSPMINSGLTYGDRILAVDGHAVYSDLQLSSIVNEGRALLTIQRDGKVLLRRVPRVKVKELRPEPNFKEELRDWQYEAGLSYKKLPLLYAIPYDLTAECVVESRVRFIDDESEAQYFPKIPFSDLEQPLQNGDKIIAIDGNPVDHSYQIFARLQNRSINVVVIRDPRDLSPVSTEEVQSDFNSHVNWNDLNAIISSIGTENKVVSRGNLALLKPVQPVKYRDLLQSNESQLAFLEKLRSQRKKIEEIENLEQRAIMLKELESLEKKLVLGVSLQDRPVVYNPSPLKLFSDAAGEIWHTFTALFSGMLSLKWMSGPVGIVKIVQTQAKVGYKEALYWMAFISLNLGILNLLPFPVLDGGTILVSALEMITGKRVNPKVYEKIVMFFALILIGFLIFITYNDVLGLFF